MRLVGGSHDSEGRVEIFHNGQWGTVCDDHWSLDDAHVVCRELGFSRAITYKTAAYFGQGTGDIWMSNVACNGKEGRLRDCNFSGWRYTSSCHHGKDAGVICNGSTVIISDIVGVIVIICVIVQAFGWLMVPLLMRVA